jgi:hypothetical protein
MKWTTGVALALIVGVVFGAGVHYWVGLRRDRRVESMPIGSSRADVLRAVGEPDWKRGDDNWVYDPAWGLGWSTGLMFDKDRVSGIDLSP